MNDEIKNMPQTSRAAALPSGLRMSPPPLPVNERRTVRTESTSATSGWAARLAAMFPDRGPKPMTSVRAGA